MGVNNLKTFAKSLKKTKKKKNEKFSFFVTNFVFRLRHHPLKFFFKKEYAYKMYHTTTIQNYIKKPSKTRNVFYGNMLFTISEKKHNPKVWLNFKKLTNSLSIGVILKYLKKKQGKSFRRSPQSTNAMLIVLKQIISKKYNNTYNHVFFTLSCYNYKLVRCKSKIMKIISPILFKKATTLFWISNLRIVFGRNKGKKKKSIKKRLKKQILANFVKGLRDY